LMAALLSFLRTRRTAKMLKISQWQLNRLAAETRLDVRTIRWVLEGKGTLASRHLVEIAATQLGLALSLPPHIRAT
jgi:hypothetical protein